MKENNSYKNADIIKHLKNSKKNGLVSNNIFDRANLIRCMSFNIRVDTFVDVVNSWKNRKNIAASMIQFHRVDIAGLQEVSSGQLNDLISRLPEYRWIGVGRDDGAEKGEYNPIFYLQERFDLIRHGTFWLSQTSNKPGSKGWDAMYRRIVTWGEFRDKLTDRILLFFNTHFDNFGRTARVQSAYLLLEKVMHLAHKKPVIVTGDFNCTKDSEAYQILTGKIQNRLGLEPLKDSRSISQNGHHGPSMTFHNYKAASFFKMFKKLKELGKGPSKMEWDMTIDYIFVKNSIRVINHGVLSDTWNGIYPSDHMPVVADLFLLD